MLFHHAQQLIARLGQSGMTESALVDQFKVEAGGGTQLNNGWHVERENHGVFDLAKGYGGPLMMDSTLFLSPLRASQGFRLTNAIPEFCPWPLKLKPLTVKTLSTLAFSLCR